MKNVVENHVETAGNKLYDITVLLRSAEQRSMNADEWLRLSRVVRHALNEVNESLCNECTYGDLVSADLRIGGLQKSISRLELIQKLKKNNEAA
jgi:hypothetical protein